MLDTVDRDRSLGKDLQDLEHKVRGAFSGFEEDVQGAVDRLFDCLPTHVDLPQPASCLLKDLLLSIAAAARLLETAILGDVKVPAEQAVPREDSELKNFNANNSAPKLTTPELDTFGKEPFVNPLVQPQTVEDISFVKVNGVLKLTPTVDQWHDFPNLMRFARMQGAAKAGIFIIELPKQMRDRGSVDAFPPVKLTGSRFESIPQDNGTFKLNRYETEVDFPYNALSHDGLDDCTFDATAAVEKFEADLLQTPSLENIRYCSDLEAHTSEERRLLGLPPLSLISELDGDKLPQTKYRIPGLHTVFGYRSCPQFGSPFAMHTEDWNLYSVNHLREGRKTIVTIAPRDFTNLVEKCKQTNPTSFSSKCSQVLRHAPTYFPTKVLKEWGISHTIVEQNSGDVFVTFPNAAHQGFSHGFTDAEATNYADDGWSIEDYKECTSKCTSHPIPRSMVRIRAERHLSSSIPNTPLAGSAKRTYTKRKAKSHDPLLVRKSPRRAQAAG